MEYLPDKDFVAFKDYFDPVSLPIKDYFSLPNHVHPELLDREINIDHLKILTGSKFIAIKPLFRPNFTFDM